MAGSFAAANYSDAAHWHAVGRIYGILFYILLGGFIILVAAFLRTRRRDRARIPERAA